MQYICVMAKHISKHDTFIRAIMANQQIALDYFQICLPEHLIEKLDFSTFRQLPDTYISKDLQKSMSDILYECRMADSEEGIKISLLIEHKSYIDKNAPIQIGSYIFSGMLKQVGNSEKPSLIIPILLYHGKNHWEYNTVADLFETIGPELREFLPEYRYIFHNLGQIPDEQIQALHNKFLAASLLALKYSALKDRLGTLIPTILALAGEMDQNLQRNLIVYTFVSSDLTVQQILELITSLPTQTKENVMNTLDFFVEKGRNEGIKEGQLENTEKTVRNLIKQSLLTDDQIASALEVTVDYVADIRQQLG